MLNQNVKITLNIYQSSPVQYEERFSLIFSFLKSKLFFSIEVISIFSRLDCLMLIPLLSFHDWHPPVLMPGVSSLPCSRVCPVFTKDNLQGRSISCAKTISTTLMCETINQSLTFPGLLMQSAHVHLSVVRYVVVVVFFHIFIYVCMSSKCPHDSIYISLLFYIQYTCTKDMVLKKVCLKI